MKGNPGAMCFQESLQFGTQNYDDNVRPVFDKVREVLETLPVGHMEIDEVVIPAWECGVLEVCMVLRDKIKKTREIYPIPCWPMSGNIWKSGKHI